MLTNNKIVVFLPSNDQFVTFPENHKNYDEVYDFLTTDPDNEKGFLELFIKIATEAIEKYSNGEIKVSNGVATIDGLPLPTDVLDKLKELKADGYDWNEQRKFWGHCLLNPRKESVADLFRFISKHNLTITEDGHFLAYKAITSDFKDKHTRTFDNSVGKVVSMNRDDVVMDPNIYCAAGLHVSNLHYAQGFAGPNDIIVLVDVNPEDVVSVPKDCNAEKIRTCSYKVLKVWDGSEELPTSVVDIDNASNVITKKEKKRKQKKEERKQKNNPWTKIELQLLNKLTVKYDKLKRSGQSFDWDNVSKMLGYRSAKSCQAKFYQVMANGGFDKFLKNSKDDCKDKPSYNWSSSEIKQLKNAVVKYTNSAGGINWDAVSACLNNRSAYSCETKYRRLLNDKLVSNANIVTYFEWDNKSEKKLIKKYNEGFTYKQIADLIGTTTNAVSSKIYRLKKTGKIF